MSDDNAYQVLATRDPAPEKPYAMRVWLCPATQVHVKTYAQKIAQKLGQITWRLSASLCQPDGKVMRGDDGEPLVHDHSLFIVRSDAEGMSAEEKALKVREDFEAALRFEVAKVERAAALMHAGAAL